MITDLPEWRHLKPKGLQRRISLRGKPFSLRGLMLGNTGSGKGEAQGVGNRSALMAFHLHVRVPSTSNTLSGETEPDRFQTQGYPGIMENRVNLGAEKDERQVVHDVLCPPPSSRVPGTLAPLGDKSSLDALGS